MPYYSCKVSQKENLHFFFETALMCMGKNFKMGGNLHKMQCRVEDFVDEVFQMSELMLLYNCMHYWGDKSDLRSFSRLTKCQIQKGT